MARGVTVRKDASANAAVCCAGIGENLIAGRWLRGAKGQVEQIPDPLTGQPMLEIFEITEPDLQMASESMRTCPKYGLHNPILNVHRYLDYGAVSFKAAALLGQPEVEHFFARLIQRVSPKSYGQAQGEVVVTRKFLENFTGDNVRFLARSFGVPGDHDGQYTNGHRYPYGPVAIIAPFNFPLEIPVLQLMGALYMGNRPVLKVDSKVNLNCKPRSLHSEACLYSGSAARFCRGPRPAARTGSLTRKPKSVLLAPRLIA